jgi:hypothetical protein
MIFDGLSNDNKIILKHYQSTSKKNYKIILFYF